MYACDSALCQGRHKTIHSVTPQPSDLHADRPLSHLSPVVWTWQAESEEGEIGVWQKVREDAHV